MLCSVAVSVVRSPSVLSLYLCSSFSALYGVFVSIVKGPETCCVKVNQVPACLVNEPESLYQTNRSAELHVWYGVLRTCEFVHTTTT